MFQHGYYVKLVLGICVLLFYAIGLPGQKDGKKNMRERKKNLSEKANELNAFFFCSST